MADLVTPSNQRTEGSIAVSLATDISNDMVLTTSSSRLMDAPVYGNRYEEINNHLSSATQWTRQLTEQLCTSHSASETKHLLQALSIVRHLRLQCLNLYQLVAARDSWNMDESIPSPSDRSPPALDLQDDHIADPSLFRSVPRRLQATPSFLTQLCRPVTTHLQPRFQNYYSALVEQHVEGSIVLPATRHIVKMETAPVTLQKTSLDDLIKEFTEKDPPSPERSRMTGTDTAQSFKIRFVQRMGHFGTSDTSRDKLATALRILRDQDHPIWNLPFSTEGTSTLSPFYPASVRHTTTVYLPKYFRFKRNPSNARAFLHGNYVTSVVSDVSLVNNLQSCQHKGRVFTAGILQHPTWPP